MDNDNKLPKPQEFELVELLFQEYIRPNIARPLLEYSFQARFQSFVNQIPSYLHSSSKLVFFTHFFFGSFATLLDTKLGERIGIKKLHYNFDRADTLRVIAETDDKTHVFIFTENNQNKHKDTSFTKGEWGTLIGREYTDYDNKKLEISVIKVNKSKGNIRVTVEKQNIKDSADSTKQYHEVTRQLVDEKGKYIYLDGEIPKLSSSQADKQTDTLKFILKYIKKIYDHYQILPYVAGAQEAEQHGFVAGMFNNFRYRENAHVYLEQFAGKGYADIVLLVRGTGRSTTSIPIIIELKVGSGSGTTFGEALAQAIEYTKGFQPNNMRILSLSNNILCVGMNLDGGTSSFMQMQLVTRNQEIVPLAQDILDTVKQAKVSNHDTIKKEIYNQLENTYHTFPGTWEKSTVHYFSRFIIGEVLVLQDYDKHIFMYDQDEYIPTKTIIDQHATRFKDSYTIKKQGIEKIVDISNAITTTLLISKDQSDPAIILNIIDINREITAKNIPLDANLIGNRKIISLDIKFNIDKSSKEFKQYCDVKLEKVYNSVSEYNSANNERVQGNFKKIDSAVSIDLLARIKNAIDSQKGLIISENEYKELFKKIGEVIYPIKSLVNSEAEFQGLLEGTFKYYSDTKLAKGSESRVLILTEFQTGAGGRIDMLVQAIGESVQGTKEYTPIGLELKYDNSVKLSAFDQQQDEYIQGLILRNKEQKVVKGLLSDQTERYSQGAAMKSVTDSKKVAIMGVVFNTQAKDKESLLLTTDKFIEAHIVHSSKLYSISKNVDVMSINELPKPDSEKILPDWVERETYDLLAKAAGDDDSILSLSNSLLDAKEVQRLQSLLQKDPQLVQYIDGLDLSFNAVTASNVKELIRKFRKLIYLDLSDNDLASNNLSDLEEILNDIQVPILRIADVGMNNEQMQRVLKSLAEHDKVSDLEIMHLEEDNELMSKETASIIAQYLKNTKMLNCLNLSNNKIDDVAISMIAQGLQGQNTLSSLVLTKNIIGDQGGAKELGNVLKHTAISSLDLSGNPLGISGVAEIVGALAGAYNYNIKSIALVNVGLNYNRNDRAISDKLLSSIESLFENPYLTRINIGYNAIGNGALRRIFTILSNRVEKSNIQDLSLAGNKIYWGAHLTDTDTLKSLIYDFVSKSEKIRSLDLSFMDIDDDIGKRIADALEKNVSLVDLDLGGNNHIGSETVKGLVNVLKTHQYLKYLNLSDNKLSITDLRLILGAITKNHIVSHINLSGNDFSSIINDDQTGKQYFDLNNQDIDFVNLLQGNTELKYLNLANCKLNQKSLLSLFKAIENNIGLEVLDIRDNEIENSIVDNIVESLDKNANQGLDIGLKVLHVSKGGLEQSIISKLTDKSLGISVLVEGSILPQDGLEGRLMQTGGIDPFDKKYAELNRAHQTFEIETTRGHYHYWLQAHDMVDIARVYYGYVDRPIEIIGSINQLSTHITQYFANSNNAKPMTMILNIGDNGQGGNHWVSLVLNRVGSQVHGYYIDSLGDNIAGNIASILSQYRILIYDLSTYQQTDGHNCGLWALENSRRVDDILKANINNVDINSRISSNLISRRGEEAFEKIRDDILIVLVDDNQRREHLADMGLHQVELPIDYDITQSRLQHSLVQFCLSGTLREKRSINNCKIGWNDIDEISYGKTRNTADIIIDAEKFLAYSKKHIGDEKKSRQLLSVVNEIKHQDDRRIVGNYKNLLDQVITENGYKNYIQKEQINDLGYNVISRGSDKISAVLKLKLINAAGKIQLMHGIYSSLMTCNNGDTQSCGLSVGGLGYSFLSQPIENAMVRITPKIVDNAAHGVGKVIPRILHYDTKLIVQLVGAKYGVKVAKGAGGVLAGIFDIVDIAISSDALVKCNQLASSNNTCSDKEMRDNIESIILSSLSFFSGVGLTILGSGPLAIGVGFGFLVVHGIYNGISNIIEYEEKYDTTNSENWSIFWRTVFLQRMAEDVEHLKVRHDIVDYTVKNAWNILKESPETIVAYAIGLGKIELKYAPLCQTSIQHQSVFCVGLRPQEGPCKDGGPGFIAQNVTECTIRSQYVPYFHPASSSINMRIQDIKYTKNLSRVLPAPIENATMICLPQITDAIYEKGITSSRSGAIYECDNAVVIVYNQRVYSQVKDQYIIYDLKNVDSGTIIGSNILNNIFQIFEGNPVIWGSIVLNNQFVILTDKYHGKVYLGGKSTNIIDVSYLQNQYISMEYTHIYPFTMKMSITVDNKIMSQVDGHSQDLKVRYIGRKYKGDKVVCKYLSDQEDSNIIQDNIVGHNIIIDSGGGRDYSDPDQIQNCNKVIVSPNTVVQGSNGNYTFYIISQNYSVSYAISDIDIAGRGIINFPEISLLKDCNQINYSAADNILSFNIPLNGNGTYSLQLKNYLNKDNGTNYVLIDKYGSNIVYQYTKSNNNQITGHFALYAACRFDTIQKVVNHYRKISYHDKNYAVFGTVKNNQYNFLKFGSLGSDVIISDKDVVFMEGGNGNDIYIINNDSFYRLGINNKAQDLKLDILNILCVDNMLLNMLLVKNTNDLCLSFNSTEDNTHQNTLKEIRIDNYFLDHTYQHIALMDKNSNNFIPFYRESVGVILLPFFHASLAKNIYVLSANSYEQAVIDIAISNIMFYRQDNNLLLVEKGVHDFNSLSIVLKDYYIQQHKWLDVKLYGYNNGVNSIIDLNNIEISVISYQEQYDSVIKEYVIDLSKEAMYIEHNYIRYKNNHLVNYPITVGSSDERIGIVIFKNTPLKRLKIFDVSEPIFQDKLYNNENHILIVGQWNTDSKYQISMFEFDTGLDHERIYVSNETLARIKLNNEFDRQIDKIDIKIVKVVIDYLKLSCTKYNEQNILPEKLSYSFLEEELNYRVGHGNNESYSLTEIRRYLNSDNNTVGEAFMWLVFKSYNELLLRYPNIQNKDLHKIDNSCFKTVLSYLQIEEIIKITQEQITANKDDILQYVCANKQDMQNIITGLDGVDSANIAEDSHHKHRHYHGEVHNRGRRDIEKVDFIQEDDGQDLYAVSGAASSKPMPAVYNVVKWIGGGIGTILHYLSSVEQIKYCFNKADNRIDIINNSEQSNKAFIRNVVNYDLLNMQGNLLLLDLLIRKKNGVKYNNNGVVIKNDIDNEYAQSLAYSAYIPKDQLPSSIEDNTEGFGLLGAD